MWATGTPIVISGSIYSVDTKLPIPFATYAFMSSSSLPFTHHCSLYYRIDIWHATPESTGYDYYEPSGEKVAYEVKIYKKRKGHTLNLLCRKVIIHMEPLIITTTEES